MSRQPDHRSSQECKDGDYYVNILFVQDLWMAAASASALLNIHYYY